ncbi:MAG: chromate efflux transporter [bacterium]|nr:chromate efflux transporter [bacterium]
MTTTPVETAPTENAPDGGRGSVGELARIFLRLGFTAFGGPAAHIAMFHDEFVKRRKWVSDQHFLDMLGATNLIPGPNSTEMTMHIGHVRAGWLGLVVAGACFILPAASIVLVLAWLYVEYGTTVAGQGLLYGIKPVVIAVIAQAVFNLGQKAAKTWLLTAVGVAVFVLYLLGINEILLLFGGALFVLLVTVIQQRTTSTPNATSLLLFSLPGAALAQQVAERLPEPVTLSQLFLTFLKIGGVIYGSGYVLLAFLQSDFVDRLGWLTQQQLLDAVAIGQFTPGPVFTTATFVGYVTAGVPGAVLGTLGIFLPGFIFVALITPLIPRIRKSVYLSALLDGVNVAAIGLMTAVGVELARAAFVDVVTIALGIAAAVLLIRFKVNSTWLILGGALIGLMVQAVL